jgi:hypothetical protein
MMLFAEEETCFWLLHHIVQNVAVDYYASDMAGACSARAAPSSL